MHQHPPGIHGNSAMKTTPHDLNSSNVSQLTQLCGFRSFSEVTCLLKGHMSTPLFTCFHLKPSWVPGRCTKPRPDQLLEHLAPPNGSPQWLKNTQSGRPIFLVMVSGCVPSPGGCKKPVSTFTLGRVKASWSPSEFAHRAFSLDVPTEETVLRSRRLAA